MRKLQVRDAFIFVDWNDEELKVRIYPKDEPEAVVTLNEHQIENIQRAIRQVRSETWIVSQETGT